jgi:hypothetical protein
MSLAKSSLNYIITSLEIIWKSFYIEHSEVVALTRGANLEFTTFTYDPYNVNSEKEIATLTNNMRAFSDIYDRIVDVDSYSTAKVFQGMLSISHTLMSYYLSEELMLALLHDWYDLQTILFPLDEEYRDHLLHQFYVFLLGCTILSTLQDSIVRNWKHFEIRPIQEMQRRTFRSWMSAALFHDVGYVLSKVKSIEDKICERFFPFMQGIKYQAFSTQIGSMSSGSKLHSYMVSMKKIFENNEFTYSRGRQSRKKEDTSDAALILKALEDMKHGAVSSYLFWNTIQHDIVNIPQRPINLFRYVLQAAINKRTMAYSPSDPPHSAIADAQENDNKLHSTFKQEILEDIDVAAYAIAIHDLKGYSKINFYTHPIAFLLVLCDELQQWGRTSFDKNYSPSTCTNECIECKTFIKDRDEDELRRYIADVTNLEAYSGQSKDIFVETLGSDIIIVRFDDVTRDYANEFNKRLSELFRSRLVNGPSLIVTNRVADRDECFFLARAEKSSIQYVVK